MTKKTTPEDRPEVKAQKRTPEKPTKYVALEKFRDQNRKLYKAGEQYEEINAARTKQLAGKGNKYNRPFIKAQED